ncbi:MAG: ABC transporter ATP-binding protein [Clostridia bacterium]|nr:ABC transporter ATP-binding protein [Clostridia bacterium]
MIKCTDVIKTFDGFNALYHLNCTIPDGSVYGMVGSNGAGKSTLLRLLTGIYKADTGSIEYDGQPIYENTVLKDNIVFIPDELFFLPQSNMERMAKLYESNYSRFDMKKFMDYAKAFGLNIKANINTFSKGMKRQAATILALACNTKYVFLDETFDGLDPVIRNLVKKLIYAEVEERGATVIITSHSLRELEDTCDQLALLHKGGIVFESDIQNLKTSLFKVQVAFKEQYDKSKFENVNMLNYSQRGSVANIIVKGDREETTALFEAMSPVLYEILPLSLEEVFVYEMEALGYSFDEVLA